MLKLIRQERTNDYLVHDENQEIGMLYETENEELSHCWIFCAHAPGFMNCRAYIYSSPEMAARLIPAEIRGKEASLELYERSAGMFF